MKIEETLILISAILIPFIFIGTGLILSLMII